MPDQYSWPGLFISAAQYDIKQDEGSPIEILTPPSYPVAYQRSITNLFMDDRLFRIELMPVKVLLGLYLGFHDSINFQHQRRRLLVLLDRREWYARC